MGVGRRFLFDSPLSTDGFPDGRIHLLICVFHVHGICFVSYNKCAILQPPFRRSSEIFKEIMSSSLRNNEFYLKSIIFLSTIFSFAKTLISSRTCQVGFSVGTSPASMIWRTRLWQRKGSIFLLAGMHQQRRSTNEAR
jgi:hypothetical protein